MGASAGVACGLVGVALCAGCASPSKAPSQAPPIAAPAEDVAPPAAAAKSPLAAFESRQRAAAHAAARQGRWADAQWAWDVVLALAPEDPEARQQRVAAHAAAMAAVAERLPRAQQAQHRGDWDAATRLYLEVLAIDPGHAAAADALREIGRVHTRRGQTGASRDPYAARSQRAATAPARSSANKPSAPAPSPAGNVNDREHASLLASQGDVDAAIQMLKPMAHGTRADPQARQQLANLYFRQASRLELSDRSGAIAALENGLALDPANRYAAARLKLLRAAPAMMTTPTTK
ncbi:MAG TPA: hypothetical protein VIW70_18895 [Rubrivivax sp.]